MGRIAILGVGMFTPDETVYVCTVFQYMKKSNLNLAQWYILVSNTSVFGDSMLLFFSALLSSAFAYVDPACMGIADTDGDGVAGTHRKGIPRFNKTTIFSTFIHWRQHFLHFMLRFHMSPVQGRWD